MHFKKISSSSSTWGKALLVVFSALLLKGCATSGSEPRVREGQLPDADAFGIISGEGTYGEERTRHRVSRFDQGGTIVQADRDISNYMVRTQNPLPETVQVLVAAEGAGVLYIFNRSSTQQLFAVTALEGQFELSQQVRIPTSAEQAKLLEQYSAKIEALTP